MLLLYKFQETRHIRTSKVINSLQSREHGRLRESLEVIFTNVLNKKNEVIKKSLNQAIALLTNMVVLKSNLWKNCVMKM